MIKIEINKILHYLLIFNYINVSLRIMNCFKCSTDYKWFYLFVAIAIICFTFCFVEFFHGYYPIISMINSDSLQQEMCSVQFYGCYLDNYNNELKCNCTVTYPYDQGISSIQCNYTYTLVPANSTICYVNRCNSVFSNYDFYMNDCEPVQQNFDAVFLPDRLEYQVYLGLGILFAIVSVFCIILASIFGYRLFRKSIENNC